MAVTYARLHAGKLCVGYVLSDDRRDSKYCLWCGEEMIKLTGAEGNGDVAALAADGGKLSELPRCAHCHRPLGGPMTFRDFHRLRTAKDDVREWLMDYVRDPFSVLPGWIWPLTPDTVIAVAHISDGIVQSVMGSRERFGYLDEVERELYVEFVENEHNERRRDEKA